MRTRVLPILAGLVVLVVGVVLFATRQPTAPEGAVLLQWQDGQQTTAETREGIALTVDQRSVTSTGLTYTLTNQTGGTLCWGYDYYVFHQEGEGWKEPAYLGGEEPGWWKTLMISWGDGDGWSNEAMWSHTYGDLPPGEYLLVKPVSTDEQVQPGEGGGYVFAAFRVS